MPTARELIDHLRNVGDLEDEVLVDVDGEGRHALAISDGRPARELIANADPAQGIPDPVLRHVYVLELARSEGRRPLAEYDR